MTGHMSGAYADAKVTEEDLGGFVVFKIRSDRVAAKDRRVFLDFQPGRWTTNLAEVRLHVSQAELSSAIQALESDWTRRSRRRLRAAEATPRSEIRPRPQAQPAGDDRGRYRGSPNGLCTSPRGK
ncbi:hypothetical protein BCD48_27855 [Pseudofrankia sp. BMG5.36]|nr:hypothetical protein BCD48_27855 [Pseudofrankia sp. BMG5.36]